MCNILHLLFLINLGQKKGPWWALNLKYLSYKRYFSRSIYAPCDPKIPLQSEKPNEYLSRAL